jgi:ATP-dependent 26S proteasome regulatory subunit
LYGPSGSGKTELVHAVAAALGAALLYVPAGDLLKSYEEHGHKLLRALFKVRRHYSPA